MEVRLYRKIDIYVDRLYVCSTRLAKTCGEAIQTFLYVYPQYKGSKIEAYFRKKWLDVYLYWDYI